MSSQRYTQLTGMLDSGQLIWQSNRILAVLVTGVEFNPDHQRISDAGGVHVGSAAPIENRYVDDSRHGRGNAVGFNNAPAETPFEVLIVKDDGSGNPLLLGFLDSDSDGLPISIPYPGTCIIRPAPDEFGELPGIWITLI